MIFNTQQLQYLIEIERTRSISQAAVNLYMGQPNLSRMLRDVETALGFPIFERARRGVRPTEKGVIFLQHARNILREADFMEQLGPNAVQANRFRICLPRSYYYMEQVTQFLRSLLDRSGLEAYIRECHPRQALELLDNGSAEIAVIRYATEYQDYFAEQAIQRKLMLIPLSTVEYQIILADSHPLADRDFLSREELSLSTEIMHRDTFYAGTKNDREDPQVYAVDRMAQLQLLKSLPGSYLWAEPLPTQLLKRAGLRQLPCTEAGTVYKNVLAYKPQCAMSDTERSFLSWIRQAPDCTSR